MTTELTEDEWREATTYDLIDWHRTFSTEGERDAAWCRFLARVRRDAAREALDGYAAQFDASAAAHGRDGLRICQINAERDAWRVRRYRDAHYPEETP